MAGWRLERGKRNNPGANRRAAAATAAGRRQPDYPTVTRRRVLHRFAGEANEALRRFEFLVLAAQALELEAQCLPAMEASPLPIAAPSGPPASVPGAPPASGSAVLITPLRMPPIAARSAAHDRADRAGRPCESGRREIDRVPATSLTASSSAAKSSTSDWPPKTYALVRFALASTISDPPLRSLPTPGCTR